MRRLIPVLFAFLLALPALPTPVEPSAARLWNEEILAAIRIDLPHPPVHARNLFHLSAAMYDAWAAYDSVAVGYLYRQKAPPVPDKAAARHEAISYAAYRLLVERYALSRSAERTLAEFKARLLSLGYDPENRSQDPKTPAGVGNGVAAVVSAFFLEDGALQLRGYRDLPVLEGGYGPVNPPLLTFARGTRVVNVNRWQPLALTNAITQNQLPADAIQKFVGSQWLGVRPFALGRADPKHLWIDPGPPPQLGGASDAQFRREVVEVIRRSSELTSDDGVVIDVSPGVMGNNSLGADDGSGHPINPVTGFPYASNPVKRGDFARVLTEFWADGPHSETPPGHWNVLANTLSDQPHFPRRLGGTGPELDSLEWDIKLYFTLNAALHDAACAAWSLKRIYDSCRPIAVIRFMGQLGQSTSRDELWYDPSGLPLESGLIEVVTRTTAVPGGRHAGLPIGEIAILAWPGQPVHPSTQSSGVHWVLATEWVPYQHKDFVSPAFPGFVSGHSTFSRAAAEVLTAFTGSPFFPGGLGVHIAPKAAGLTIERGPSETVQLQWATYYDAADQAGLSRIWGGIHFPADDFAGRIIGARCGNDAWALARQYFDASILNPRVVLKMRPVAEGKYELGFETARGFYYRIQSTPDLSLPFADVPSVPSFQALDSFHFQPGSLSQGRQFYRAEVRLHADE